MTPIKFNKISSRDATPSQRKATEAAVWFLRESTRFNGVTSVRVSIDRGPASSAVFFQLNTRRSDCDPQSTLAVLTAVSIFGVVTPRGKVTIFQASHGSLEGDEYPRHVAKMLDAHYQSQI